MTNLANNPQHAPLQQELDAKLQAQLKQRGDAFRDGEYYKQHWGYVRHNAKGNSPKNQLPEE